jgi:capsular exopolysaccharide synthesis family protein
MSRILDALRKREGGAQPTPIERAQETAPPGPAAAPPAPEPEPEPVLAETAAPPEVWQRGHLPDIPEDFLREMGSLRLQVDTALTGRRPRVLMFVSAAAGEGSSTVAATFARVLALDQTSRVLLVDANARRPGLSTYFGLPEGPGLPEVLHSGYPFADTVRAVERQNLHVMPSMPGQANSGNLYAQQLVRAFLSQYGTHYDYVIFDAPPVLESPETTVLGGAVDTSLLVVRAARTKGGVVNRAIESLAKAGVPVLGVVLNRRRLDIPEFLYKRI